MSAGGRLTTRDHDRGSAGSTYVYAVVSRRAGGVSVGINLNPNQACNWRCAYCQVPGLVRGKGPAIDLDLLQRELEALLAEILEGDFMRERVPEGMRRLNDVAFSGNGEPTTSPDFLGAVARVEEVLRARDLAGALKVVLITNGSLVDKAEVQAGLDRVAALGGEVWFKLDRATKAGLREVNDTGVDPADHLARLERCARRCPTWVQTCVFAREGAPPSEAEQVAYLAALGGLVAAGVPLRGVLLYGLARESHQPEQELLSALPGEWLEAYAERIRALGLEVRVSA